MEEQVKVLRLENAKLKKEIVKTETNWFYLVISLVGLSVIILTLEIIVPITKLPIEDLAYPDKFSVIRKNNKAQQQRKERQNEYSNR